MLSEPTNPSRSGQKFARKRFNEHVKLLSSFVNTLSLGILGAGLVIPVVNTGQLNSVNVIWIVVGITLHLCAQVLLRLLLNED